MKPILKIIAEAYSERYVDLSDICFLFPNKRCGTFFCHYLQEAGLGKGKWPIVKTISTLISDISGLKDVNKIESLFTLYNVYRQYQTSSGDDILQDFESFRVWGETVLSDFNTVDQYLVNPNDIFKNVKDYRKLTSNFLTEEQKEVLYEYFGQEYFDTISFWKDFNSSEKLSPIKQRFLNLWQILGPLHKEFTSFLINQGKGTVGMRYRKAVENLLELKEKAFPYKKIVVFGFNALNTSERKIFVTLQKFPNYRDKDKFIDFIWDAYGPVLNNPDNTSSRFVLSNRKKFPSPDWITKIIEKDVITNLPQINIISSPSYSMQVKIAGEILRNYREERGKSYKENETALVLPDETLLVNTLYSIPDEFENINLTMGYPLRQTGIASFMSLLRRLYATTRNSSGQNIYFHKDLKLFLSHTITYLLFEGSKIDNLLSYISTHHKISISAEEIRKYLDQNFEFIDFPPKGSPSHSIFNLLDLIFARLMQRLTEENSLETSILEKSQISEYYKNIEIIKDYLNIYNIEISSSGILYMIDRVISNINIGFEGEPLEGLQIMGSLETRGLDFKDIVIVSMNEGMMPRKSKTKSFIPDILRKAYGLPPSKYNEEIFAYYFFRLISRAEHVSLIYDGRKGGGLKKGEESRYILQLKHLYNYNVKQTSWDFNLKAIKSESKDIYKDEKIKYLLEDFKTQSANRKYLSASSLNIFRECGVKFFLRSLLNINPDPESSDFLDPISIGIVLHDVMMELYLDEKDQKKLLSQPILITKEKLENIIENKEVIKKLIAKKINNKFYKLGNDQEEEPLPTTSQIIADQIADQIETIIKYDINFTPFKLYGCEISLPCSVEITSIGKINFKIIIDRLDEIDIEGKPQLRIIDYKTGARKREADSIEEVLNGDYRSEQIFQLFLYAWLLNKFNVPGKEDVLTEIYFVPDMVAGKRGFPKIAKKDIRSYSEFADDFDKGIKTMLINLFKEEYFYKSKNPDACLECSFKTICFKSF